MNSLNWAIPFKSTNIRRRSLRTISPFYWILMVVFGGLFLLEAVLLGLNVFHMRPAWDLNVEKNFPTYFSATLLASNASLSVLIFLFALVRRLFKHAHPIALPGLWLILAMAFAFLAMDEANEWHERITNVVMDQLGIKGRVSLAFWEVVYSPFLAMTGGAMALLIIRNRRTAMDFSRTALVAAILWGVALVMEYVGLSIVGGIDEGFKASYMIEETCEMLGSTLFLLASVFLLREYKSGTWKEYPAGALPATTPIVEVKV